MKQLGGPQSGLFSLTARELATFEERVREGQFQPPLAVRPEGPAGALVRFRSADEAMLVKVAIV